MNLHTRLTAEAYPSHLLIKQAGMQRHHSKPTVFILSSIETLGFAQELAQQLEPVAMTMLWSKNVFDVASPVTSQLGAAISRCDFAICLLDANFEDRHGRRGGRAPQNAIFELGFVAGALGVDRLLIVTISGERYGAPLLPSDIAGLKHVAIPEEGIADATRGYAQRVVSEVTRALRTVEPRPEQLASSFSCFISYARHDRIFASKLHQDLTEIGIRCWLDAHELRIGDSLIDSIEGGLRASDRMIAVLSSSAVESRWLATELRLAFDLEQERSSQVVLPVRLDNSVFDADAPVWKVIRDRYIADFTEWRDPREYKRAFASLARGLTLSVAQESVP